MFAGMLLPPSFFDEFRTSSDLLFSNIHPGIVLIGSLIFFFLYPLILWSVIFLFRRKKISWSNHLKQCEKYTTIGECDENASRNIFLLSLAYTIGASITLGLCVAATVDLIFGR